MTKQRISIEFEDQGQDFLVWDLEYTGSKSSSLGKVAESRPFQNSIWQDMYVLNMKELAPGKQIVISKGPGHDVITIKYPLLSVGSPVAVTEKEASHG